MIDTVKRYLAHVSEGKLRETLRVLFNALADRYSTQSLTSAGLVIKAGGSAVVKTGASAWYGLVQGKLQTKAAATDMPALSGTVTNAKFNVYVFLIDVAGTVTSAMGTEGATLAAVKWPPIPVNKAVLGFVIINPTGTGGYVGGTTALDDVTVVPNAAYVNVIGPFDPSVLL